MSLSAGELVIGKTYLTKTRGKVLLLEKISELHPLGIPTEGMEVWRIRCLEDGMELMAFTLDFLEEVE